ncbi:MAG: hypothetical protein FJ293_04575 [Planctomycetes bacterium]|nr:hypothetical protein [Planctomycetota bacterium]
MKIETPFGTTEVERSRIDKIERGKTPKEVFAERKAALGKTDVVGRWDLVLYCKQQKLNREAKALVAEILTLDPEHADANRENGKIQYDGKWFTKEQLETYQAEERKKMEAAGMVWQDGRWMTEDDAMTARGLVKVDGKWISKEELDRLTAARDWQATFGTEMNVLVTDHFELRTPLPLEDLQEIVDLCEMAHAEFIKLAEPDEKEIKFMDPAKSAYSRIYLYVHAAPGDVTKFIESGFIDRHYVPPSVKEDHIESDNFSVYFPVPFIVLSEGRHLKSSESRDVNQAGMALVHLGQILVRRLKRGGGLPGWAEAGMGHWAEGEFNGYSTLSIVEYPHYEPFVDKWSVEGWENFPRWKDKLSDAGEIARVTPLSVLMEKPVEELTIDEEAKAWSLVLFLMETRRKQFFDFVRAAKSKFHDELVGNTQAFTDAFAPESIAHIDAEWASWVRTLTKGEAKTAPPQKPLGGG